MTDAREIIAAEILPLDRECAENVIAALTAAGFRFLGKDEVDPVTVEKCADVAAEYPLVDYKPGLSAGSELNAFMDGQDSASLQIAEAIRAIGRKA